MSENLTMQQKLDQLEQESKDYRTYFEVVVEQQGKAEKEYKPKLKDKDGNVLKNDDGSVKRGDPVGWMYTTSEWINSETCRFILPKHVKLTRGGKYKVTGRGYGSVNGSKFIDKDVHIKNF